MTFFSQLRMNSRLFSFLGNEMKFYCTKIPTQLAAERSLKTLKPGNLATVTKIITENDVLSFAKLTGDYNPIHTESPKNIVHGAYLNSLVASVIGTELPGPGTIVVEQLIRYPKPCYAGDSVVITVEILSVRKIIQCKYSCVANMERLVLEGEAKLVLGGSSIKKISFTK